MFGKTYPNLETASGMKEIRISAADGVRGSGINWRKKKEILTQRKFKKFKKNLFLIFDSFSLFSDFLFFLFSLLSYHCNSLDFFVPTKKPTKKKQTEIFSPEVTFFLLQTYAFLILDVIEIFGDSLLQFLWHFDLEQRCNLKMKRKRGEKNYKTNKNKKTKKQKERNCG